MTGDEEYYDNPVNMLMNLVQGNFVAGFPNGVEFTYVSSGPAEAGISHTIMGGNFFASNGSIESTEIVAGMTDSDPFTELTDQPDQWQGYWN